jgi:hypothetical protein
MNYLILILALFVLSATPVLAQQGKSDSILNNLNDIYGEKYEQDSASSIWKKDLKLQRYLNYYYLNKPVFLTPQMMARLVELGYLDQKPEAQNYVIGFFAVLFKQNPQAVRGWLDQLNVTQYQAGAFIRAARHAGLGSIARDWVKTKDWEYTEPAEGEEDVFSNLTLPIENDVDTAEAVQRLWGGYAVSGDKHYLDRLFDALLITDVPLNQIEINKGEYDSFMKRALNELLEGLLINASVQYNDVYDYLAQKAEDPALQTNMQMRRIVIKATQEREKANADL